MTFKEITPSEAAEAFIEQGNKSIVPGLSRRFDDAMPPVGGIAAKGGLFRVASDIQPIMRRVKIHRRSRMETPLRRNLTAYTFLLPWFTGMLCLTVGAMLFTFYLAFTDYDLISSPEWVGFDNFQQILRDPNFWISIRATFTYVIFSVPARLIVSLLIALLLYREVRGIGWYRSLIYLPSLIGTSVGAAIGWRNLFADDGPVNAFLGLFGSKGPIGWEIRPPPL